MRLSLLVICLLLCNVATGQVVMTGSSNPFSINSLKHANDELTASQSVYKVIYMSATSVLLPPADTITSTTTIQQLLERRITTDNTELQTAFKAQQSADLDTAQAYFDRLDDKEHTILVLDNFATTVGLTEPLHLSGRNFIFGTAVAASTKQIVSGYSPAARMDFTDTTRAQNDKYLDEYASFLSSIGKGNGSGSVVEDVYPKGVVVAVVIVESTGYVHVDPAARLTEQELEDLEQPLKPIFPTLKNIVFTPLDYTVKKGSEELYHVTTVYLYKLDKNSKFVTFEPKDATKSWTLNDKLLDSKTVEPKLDFQKDQLIEGENTLLITTDLGKYPKNNFKNTFDIKFFYNKGNYIIKAAINGKTPISIEQGADVSSDEGGTPLKVGDVVDLHLYKKTNTGEVPVEDAIWTFPNQKKETANRYSSTMTETGNDILVEPYDGANAIYIKFNVKAPDANEPAYSFSNLDVTGLTKPKDQEKAKKMFKIALAKIQNGDPDIYNYFAEKNAMIQSYALPASDNNLTIEGNPANGVTIKNYAVSFRYDHLDIANIKKDENNIVQDATLIVRLSGDDQTRLINSSNATTVDGKTIAQPLLNELAIKDQKKASQLWRLILEGKLDDSSLSDLQLDDKSIDILKKASSEKNEFGKNSADRIIERIAKSDPAMGERLRKLVNEGTLTKEMFKDFYEIVPDDINVLKTYSGMLDSKKIIYLNYTNLNKDQKFFTGVTVHEMLHIHFPCHHLLSALTWQIMREKKAIYNLEWGKSECSIGEGHEANNPENQVICTTQEKYDPKK